MPFSTDDVRIEALRPLIPPAILMEEIPLSEEGKRFVFETRRTCEEIIQGTDDRLMAVVGPCSIHDAGAAREYASLLSEARKEFGADLEILMRVYFEKPRSRSGWKGLINDPFIDGSFQINKGLRLARQLLVDLADRGIPAGCEFLDTITPQFIADCVSWGSIGARTTESQVHRELASGLSAPIGFKNGTDGNIKPRTGRTAIGRTSKGRRNSSSTPAFLRGSWLIAATATPRRTPLSSRSWRGTWPRRSPRAPPSFSAS
jgi:3-deoxy-7-phosphoheptulonate synthase